MGKKSHFLSIFPPSFILFSLGSIWGSAVGAWLGLAFNVIINTTLLFAILLIVLYLTRNAQLFSAKRVFFLSFIITLATDIYSFFGSAILYYDPDYPNTPPFSYYFSPNIYNSATQILIPAVIAFVVTVFLFKKYALKNKLVVCFLVTLVNLPWISVSYYVFNQGMHDPFSRSRTISQSAIDNIKNKISSTFQGEEIVPDPKTGYKILRIEAMLNVPEDGKYTIKPYLFDPTNPPNEPNTPPTSPYQPILDYYINGIDDATAAIYGVSLVKGVNKITFDIPYVRATDGKINIWFEGQNIKGPHGPFGFEFIVNDLKTDQGSFSVNFSSSTYTTKQYSQGDWYK